MLAACKYLEDSDDEQARQGGSRAARTRAVRARRRAPRALTPRARRAGDTGLQRPRGRPRLRPDAGERCRAEAERGPLGRQPPGQRPAHRRLSGARARPRRPPCSSRADHRGREAGALRVAPPDGPRRPAGTRGMVERRRRRRLGRPRAPQRRFHSRCRGGTPMTVTELHERPTAMTHRQVLEAMSGLLLAMFVAILSSTVVSTSLPRIVGDLGGSRSAYTWVVTSTLLALTISTPIWGKLADLFDRKLLVQTALLIFVAGSILRGLAQSIAWLISCRVIQGVGVGGLTALTQAVLSDLVSPRERGRYSGYLGAVFGVGTVAGPLLGGVVTDSFGWRWCFYVGVPFAVAAIVVLQRTLRLPVRRRAVS